MSEPKFTPAPWRTIPCPSCKPRPCGKLMVDGPHNTDGRFDAADARLIAAAPDMADALRADRDLLLALVQDLGSGDLLARANAAIGRNYAALRKAGVL